jgi:hypothetical protein
MRSFHLPLFLLEIGIRWLARLLAAFFVGVVLLFLGAHLAEGGLHPLQLSAQETVLMVFFFTTCIGMVVGWGCEVTGGIMVVVGVLSFYAIHLAATGRSPHGWFFPLMLLPGLLFLVSGCLRRRRFHALVS